MALGLALAVIGSACSVSTQVSVAVSSAQGGGSGTVRVVVDFDSDAVASLGGLAALRSELDLSGLSRAGWSVTGPTPGPGGGAEVTASHPFSSSASLSSVLSSVAGPGVFSARLVVHQGFWSTTYRLGLTADLTCGLSCFGDAGLRQSTGSPLGVSPPASAAANFHFAVSARLPGGVGAASAAPLGKTVPVTVSARVDDRAHRIGALVAAALVLVVLIVSGGWAWSRRRRRRRSGGGRRRRPSADGPRPDPGAVTPDP